MFHTNERIQWLMGLSASAGAKSCLMSQVSATVGAVLSGKDQLKENIDKQKLHNVKQQLT